MKKNVLKLLTGSMVVFTLLAGCTQGQPSVDQPAEVTQETVEEPTAEPTEAPAETTEEPAEEAAPVTTKDRSGNDIVLPTEINAIVSMSPATTRALIDMGYADKIVASDTNSQYSYGLELADEVLYMDMMSPDQEKIVELAPDIVFTSGMSSTDGNDAYANVRAAGLP